MKHLEDLVKWKIQQNLPDFYQLQSLISQLQSKIKELESELAEANKELELLRPFGIVWRSPKKKDVKVTK